MKYLKQRYYSSDRRNMKIHPTKISGNFQQLDRAVREKESGMVAQMNAIAESLIKSQSSLNPYLCDPSHNRDPRRHTADFII